MEFKDMKDDPHVEDDDFYFESDHLALRYNGDYRAMIRHIVSLECYKIKIIEDIEKLHSCQTKALDDPQQFVQDLKDGSIDFPLSYNMPAVPVIDWSQYGMTREPDPANRDKTSDSEQDASNILIRGRIYNESKPQTFNQLWTFEEQKRLEELLVQFPEEEVEMRRWSKIAEALGNRTAKQVMSRVQKYFLKLQRAGLPVPKRHQRSHTSKANRHKFLQKRSTFFPAHHVPVLMEDEMREKDESEYDKPTWTPAELMRAVYECKKFEESSQKPLSVHFGVSCHSCKCESIVGTRWADSNGTNWCSDCLVEFQPTTRMSPMAIPIPNIS